MFYGILWLNNWRFNTKRVLSPDATHGEIRPFLLIWEEKMRKVNIICLSFMFIFMNTFAWAITEVEDKNDWMAQNFIANQIKGIGLVDSYQEDESNVSYVYDNALAAIACMAAGNFGLAKEILDTLSSEVKTTSEVFSQSYYYSDTSGGGSGTSYAGNSAWILQAFNIYQKQRSSRIYYTMQKKLADFLISLQDTSDGALRGSKSEYWKSAESNIAAYVALKNFGRLNNLKTYSEKADKIKSFLLNKMWNGTYFYKGLTESGTVDTEKVTDTQSLGVLLFGSGYSNALSWAESNLKVTDYYNSQAVTGFDFNGDLDTVWLEGTLQMALAYYKINNSSKGNSYYNEAVKTAQSDGALLLATNEGSAGEYWTLQAWRAIAPTSWLIMYYCKFSPLILY